MELVQRGLMEALANPVHTQTKNVLVAHAHAVPAPCSALSRGSKDKICRNKCLQQESNQFSTGK